MISGVSLLHFDASYVVSLSWLPWLIFFSALMTTCLAGARRAEKLGFWRFFHPLTHFYAKHGMVLEDLTTLAPINSQCCGQIMIIMGCLYASTMELAWVVVCVFPHSGRLGDRPSLRPQSGWWWSQCPKESWEIKRADLAGDIPTLPTHLRHMKVSGDDYSQYFER